MTICILGFFSSVLIAKESQSPSLGEDLKTPEVYVPTGFPRVVVVSGTNYEMGVQYGEQTANATIHNLALFKSNLYKRVPGGPSIVTTDMQAWDYYLRKYDPTLKEWLDGMAQGCKNRGFTIDYLDLVLLMVYPTELWARPVKPYPDEMKLEDPNAGVQENRDPEKSFYHSCNSFAATGTATIDKKPIHAITQMAGTEMMDNIILLAFPESGYSFVAQTYAGRVNANSAMNSAGLAWTMTAITSHEPVWGLTEVYFHYLAQLASSRADAINYLEKTPRGGVAGGFILSDPTGIDVFETFADAFARRSPSENGGFVVQTNHLVDPKLQSYNPNWLVHMGTFERYDTVFQHLTEAAPGAVDFEFAKHIFSSVDWYDKKKQTWVRNAPGSPFLSNSHTSVSESIFLPGDLTAYLATGTPSGNGIPAYATGEYVKIKLSGAPTEVIDQANADTVALYWEAADFFEKEMNLQPKPSYLTIELISEIRTLLDHSMEAYSVGTDRAAYAFLEKNAKKKNALRGSAMTSLAEAQLYAQMAITALNHAGATMKQLKSGELNEH